MRKNVYDIIKGRYLNALERFTTLLERDQASSTEVASNHSTSGRDSSVPSTSNQSTLNPSTSNQLAHVPSALNQLTSIPFTSGPSISTQSTSVPLIVNQYTSNVLISSQSAPLPNVGLPYIPNTKLPYIKIPRFSGNPEKWLTFKNLFHSLIVTSPTLSAVEKLQYLKTHLEGAAFNLVEHTALTAENFQKTWDAFIEFYENTRLLINSTLQSLFNLKRVTKESGTELQQLYANVMQLYRTFETLECPIAHWDHFLIFICTQKLDVESNKLWEAQLGSIRKPPWKQFYDFLFSRMSALKSFESSQQKGILQSTKQQSAKVHHQGQTSNTYPNPKGACVLCKERHFISFCPKYTSKTTQQKLAFISSQKLCYNCLGLHRVSHCRITKRCQKCSRKHHTSIHVADFSKSKEKENRNPKQETRVETSSKQDARVLYSHQDE
ncbi:Gag-pol polyprotein [Temnothorax longispinosus]|uniref:Gag-pol polyprotein n=1 Tax=Temnothorax longispinosus TaxID=300112 RepID=A0A4S2KH08_9HYME|nr:Gag-pol polyprotein [Temnothorax longispinosus]